jgi:hypothetical protein
MLRRKVSWNRQVKSVNTDNIKRWLDTYIIEVVLEELKVAQ